MSVSNKREPAILLAGDIFFFIFALWLMLLVRYGSIPSIALFYNHLTPFSLLFVVWILVFFVSGLYDRNVAFFKNKLPETIIRSQIVNVAFAGLFFFFFISYFEIAPKTNLLIYLVISSPLVILWRLYLSQFFGTVKRENALLLGSGKELHELEEEVNNNEYNLYFLDTINVDNLKGDQLSDRIFVSLRDDRITTVVVDRSDDKLRRILVHLYKPIFSNTQFIEFSDVYEEVFERVPLSSVDYEWLMGESKTENRVTSIFKRLFDLVFASIIGIVVILLVPILWILMKLDDGGQLFINQKRIGQRNTEITVFKFRTMKLNETSSGEWLNEHGEKNIVTKLGKFLRKTSIDELPQFINILKGEMSLIGPRSDIVGLGARLNKKIPYYSVRYHALPGITGWAQVKQQYFKGNISPQSVEESRLRLAYDFYYIKHYSFLLDMSIALRTIKPLISRLI